MSYDITLFINDLDWISIVDATPVLHTSCGNLRLTCHKISVQIKIPSVWRINDTTSLRISLSRKILKAWIEKNQADIQGSEEAIRRLEGILKKAVAATLFLKTVPEEARLELWYPVNWEKYPELDYRNEMDGLYSNDPLKQFREENGELLTGRKYRKYVA